MINSGSFQTKILRLETSPEDYRIYKAALEWDLIDPIVIESRADVKSEARWRWRVEPFNHQVNNLITFCRRLPVTLLADDVGLGKTISAGLIMSELIARGRLSRTLIVAPKLLGPQWAEELASKFNIPTKIATGKDLLSAEPDDVGAVITTYHSAREYLNRLPSDRFQMLVLDEAHKLRNLYGVEKPPQVALRFKQALEERRFRYVLMLTATPIQNRLWDLYSLVDLLTVARGHENPFGSVGAFARKFIADDREQARQLKPEATSEFRSIVYGYMSRVRRGDAKLHFPVREVQLHRVDPTPDELALIAVVAKGIEPLNRLAQISILQALTSSPHALSAQLNNMERNQTVAPEFASAVRTIVGSMKTSAKLIGLGVLIDRLKQENHERWRLVIFTSRRETQTTIQSFLEEQGLTVGIINGSSGPRNQDTLAQFRENPPRIRVIVSTEAGSEGVNLQVANVLVNYDLPWNPMIVEQRIGRIQRLASDHANVGIFNITLRGTFEEYIVGRLMEKLQTATSAIGDIEALLEGAGLSSDEGDMRFEERIRQLVMAALKGADVEAAMQKAIQSISEAKETLEREEQRLDELLGADGKGYVGPRAPTLPPLEHSMSLRDFVVAALKNLGAKVTQTASDLFEVEQDGFRERIRLSENQDSDAKGSNYVPGSPAFVTLVQKSIATGVHSVRDLDTAPSDNAEEVARTWVKEFGGEFQGIEFVGARRWFSGSMLVRTRATVAHDSYERIVEVPFGPRGIASPHDFNRDALKPLERVIESIESSLGVPSQQITTAAKHDPAITEFSRFYLERRVQEIASAGGDERKRKKLEEDFTPRLSFTVVGAKGGVLREVKLRAKYRLDGEGDYDDELIVVPTTNRVSNAPPLEVCETTGKQAPVSCLGECAITGKRTLRHKLVKSEISGRAALPEKSLFCEQSHKRVLEDEVATSSVTGRKIAKQFLKASAVSGKLGEAEYFGRCEFSGVDALQPELVRSEISGKLFRGDERFKSATSELMGHRSEFVTCHETRQTIALSEAEQCAKTGHYVRQGILQECEETGSRVLPEELARSAVSGKRVLKSLLVASRLSGAAMLESEAVRSSSGKFCLPTEARECMWGGQLSHPDDLRTCDLTGLPIHFQFVAPGTSRLEPLVQLLEGVRHDQAIPDSWERASIKASAIVGSGKWRIIGAILSPNHGRAAIVAEVRTLLGLKTRNAGFVFEPASGSILGRIALGKRGHRGWTADG